MNSATTSTKTLHVIFGAGPVGCWIARTLRAWNIPVRAVNRSGQRPALMPEDVEMIAADLSDADQALKAAQGATALYQALNPPYHRWQEDFPTLQANALAAAQAANARYISIENLYMYDDTQPIREDSPIRPRSKKGELRARMAEEVMDMHQRGDIQATALRSSDYYGPGVVQSAMGERVFGTLVAGKKAELMGRADQPHSWAYIEDVGQAAALLGTRDEALGRAWITPHAPPVTQGEMVAQAATILGVEPAMMTIPGWMMTLVGLFNPDARAAKEMLYQLKEPFVVDTDLFQQTFGLAPTPIQKGLEQTLAWYKTRTHVS